MTRTFEVEVSDSTAEDLEKYDKERVISEVQETLSTLAEEAPRKQEELRRNMGLPEEPAPKEDELSEEEFKEEMQAFLRGDRKDDPRLD